MPFFSVVKLVAVVCGIPRSCLVLRVVEIAVANEVRLCVRGKDGVDVLA